MGNESSDTGFLAQYESELCGIDKLEIGSSRRPLTSNKKVTDMPVDPNESTYCFCNRVAFGDMVGCDNPTVKIVQMTFLMMILVHNRMVPF